MEQKPPKPMTPFDNATMPHHLYMLKLLFPYTPPPIQRMLAVYIKFSELQYTIRHFRKLSRQKTDTNLFSELKPYMNKEEQEQMEQIEDMMNMMEMVQNMPSMSDPMFQSASEDGNTFHPLDFMMDMVNPENREMFDMYSSIFGNTEDSKKTEQTGDMPGEQQHYTEQSSKEQKGDITYERMDEQSRNEKYGSGKTGTH